MATPAPKEVEVFYRHLQSDSSLQSLVFPIEDPSHPSVQFLFQVLLPQQGAGRLDWPTYSFSSEREPGLLGYIAGWKQQYAQQLLKEGSELRKPNPASDDPQAQWIREHGTPTLQRAYERGYNVTGDYVRERAAKELPGFQVDTAKRIKLSERVNPSRFALELEEETLRKLLELREQYASVRVEYVKDPQTLDTKRSISGEVVVVHDYLGKYRLVAPVEPKIALDPFPVRSVLSKLSRSRRDRAPKFLKLDYAGEPGIPLVVTFASPKGGVGKSTTAANFAAYLAKAAQMSGLPAEEFRVLLVDGDVANGNLAIRVAQRMEPNLLDLLNHMDQLKAKPMNNYERDFGPYVLAHPKIENLDILAAPDNPDILNEISQEDLERIAKEVSRHYQAVIIDSGTQIVEHTNCFWLNWAQQVYLMVEPEIACLQSTAEFAKRARRLNLLTPERIRVAMIRADMEISNVDPKKVLGEVFSFVPDQRRFFISSFHRDATEANNAGEFLVFESEYYAEELTELVRHSMKAYRDDANRIAGALSEHNRSVKAQLEDLLENPACSELFLEGPDAVSAVVGGEKHDLRFASDEGYAAFFWSLLARAQGNSPAERALSPHNPIESMQMPDGSRLVAMIPPVVAYPTLSWRRCHQAEGMSLSLLAANGMLSPEMGSFLTQAVKVQANVLVVGEMGAGKTTLLSALGVEIPPEDRIGLVEHLAEIPLAHRHVTRISSQPGATEPMDLTAVLKTLSYTPVDRLLLDDLWPDAVGEWARLVPRLSQGSIASLHAADAQQAQLILENALAMEGVSQEYARELLTQAIDLVVVVKRSGSQRRITQIVEFGPTLNPLWALVSTKEGEKWAQQGELVSESPLARKAQAKGIALYGPHESPTEGRSRGRGRGR